MRFIIRTTIDIDASRLSFAQRAMLALPTESIASTLATTLETIVPSARVVVIEVIKANTSPAGHDPDGNDNLN